MLQILILRYLFPERAIFISICGNIIQKQIIFYQNYIVGKKKKIKDSIAIKRITFRIILLKGKEELSYLLVFINEKQKLTKLLFV